MSKQRDLKAAYKREARPMGLYVVRNTRTATAYIGAASDLDGILNRNRFELKMGGHTNKALAADLKVHGLEAFAFEIVDRLEPREGQDDRAELAVLLQMRIEHGLAAADGSPIRLVPIAV